MCVFNLLIMAVVCNTMQCMCYVAVGTVDRIRQEREQRQLLREHTSNAIVIQKTWRGRRSSFYFTSSLRSDLTKKLADIEKLTKVLALKSVSYAPPAAICADLMKMLVYRFGSIPGVTITLSPMPYRSYFKEKIKIHPLLTILSTRTNPCWYGCLS